MPDPDRLDDNLNRLLNVDIQRPKLSDEDQARILRALERPAHDASNRR